MLLFCLTQVMPILIPNMLLKKSQEPNSGLFLGGEGESSS